MERHRPRARLTAAHITVGPPGADPILRDLSLEVGAGEWLGITGANGSGKTTLALSLAGLAPVREGDVRLDSVPLVAGSAARTRVATILQEPGSQMLCDRVLDEIALTALNVGMSGEQASASARQTAELLEIRELDQHPATLSAGRQQVVLVAAALASRPQVVVADEALAHVDPPTRNRTLDLLKGEVERGLTLVWVTQSRSELARADRVLVVSRTGVAPWQDHQKAAFTEDFGPSQSTEPEIARIRIEANGHHGNRIQVERTIEIPIPRIGLVIVTGANGTGKSTLLECVAGGLRCPEVEVVWPSGGESGPRSSPLLVGERPETQIVHEQVADELTYAAVARGRTGEETLADAAELLKSLPLGMEILRRRTWSLSVGEKRLVMNLAALIAPASLLAFDEPSAGLDEERSEAMANLVQRRATMGPVLVATQDQEWIAKLKGHRVDLGGPPVQ